MVTVDQTIHRLVVEVRHRWVELEDPPVKTVVDAKLQLVLLEKWHHVLNSQPSLSGVLGLPQRFQDDVPRDEVPLLIRRQ